MTTLKQLITDCFTTVNDYWNSKECDESDLDGTDFTNEIYTEIEELYSEYYRYNDIIPIITTFPILFDSVFTKLQNQLETIAEEQRFFDNYKLSVLNQLLFEKDSQYITKLIIDYIDYINEDDNCLLTTETIDKVVEQFLKLIGDDYNIAYCESCRGFCSAPAA